MTLICYRTNGSTGWEQFDGNVDVRRWMDCNPDKTPTHVFMSGPQYQVDTIEQARFNALCHRFGFLPEHYRKLAAKNQNDILELYGFDAQKELCLFRDIKTRRTATMDEDEAHTFLRIKNGV